jgi:hypothetical protein
VQTERLRRTGDRDHDHVVQPARLDADRGHAESLRQRVEIVLLEIREAVLPQQPEGDELLGHQDTQDVRELAPNDFPSRFCKRRLSADGRREEPLGVSSRVRRYMA